MIWLVWGLLADAGRREAGFRPAELSLQRSVPLGHKRSYTVAFSRDGARVAVGGDDGSLALFDTSSWRELRRLKGHNGSVYGVAFSPDGRRLATTNSRDGAVFVWDVETGELIRKIVGGTGASFRLAFTRDGAAALVAGHGEAARVLKLPEGEAVAALDGHRQLSYACAVGGDARAATADHEGAIQIWRTTDWSRERRFMARGGLVYALSFSRDGRRLLSGGTAGELSVWDADSGRELRAFKGASGDVRCAVFSPEGRYVVSASPSGVRVLEVETGQEVRRFPGKKGTSFEAAMHPAGRMFAIVGDDGRMDVYGR